MDGRPSVFRRREGVLYPLRIPIVLTPPPWQPYSYTTNGRDIVRDPQAEHEA